MVGTPGRVIDHIKRKSMNLKDISHLVLDEADEMLSLCIGNIIEKTRYLVDYCGHTWEIDVFFGVNAGLVLAEIELESENEPFEHPDWLGKDVSDDNRYLNSSLVKYPFNQWK